MNKILRYTLLTLLWGGVAAYIVYAAVTARAQRAQKTVSSVEIVVADSSSLGNLVSERVVREWLDKSGIPIVGTRVADVKLNDIEQLIAKNGFVDRADAYISYSGVLHIDISQRKPLLRLLVDGFNAYITEEGYIFAAPRASSLYVPVVTGSYRPPIPPSFSGLVRTHIDAQSAKIEERIAEIEKEKYPLFKDELQNDRDIRALGYMRIKKQWWRFESGRAFDKRVEELRRHKDSMRREYRSRARMIQEEIDRISSRQEQERQKQKKLEKSYEEFIKLLNFVKLVEDDNFWRSEIVQIATRIAPSGALEVDLIPRSGRHIIRFGRIEDVGQKFDRLLYFYRNALTNIGWGEYEIIDVRFENQVVCIK